MPPLLPIINWFIVLFVGIYAGIFCLMVAAFSLHRPSVPVLKQSFWDAREVFITPPWAWWIIGIAAVAALILSLVVNVTWPKSES